MSTDAVFTPVAFPQLREKSSAHYTQAVERGHAAGYSAGARVAEAEYQLRLEALEAEHAALLAKSRDAAVHQLETLNAAVRALNARVAPVISDAEHTLVAASLELAEVIIGHELKDVPGSARAALDRALAGDQPAAVVSVRMHPGDLAALDAETVSSANVELVVDANLDPGDAIAVLPDGYLDARISTALARATEALLGGTR